MATPLLRRRAWRLMFEAHPHLGIQFGQPDSETTFHGATGCTHAMLQSLIFGKTHHLVSQDEISRVAGYPNEWANPERRGLIWGGRTNEVGKVIDHYNLPYDLWFPDGPLTSEQEARILHHAELGPVLMAIRYSHYPSWRNYVYDGVHSTPHPNGFALQHGKTQLQGFYGGHAILFLGWYWNKAHTFRIANVKEPNHGSTARPELANPQDKLKVAQLWPAANALRSEDGRNLCFALPNQAFHP
jgi:hypothetical protein